MNNWVNTMSINYNVDDYWENSYKPVISKDHFAKFLKGYPFQTVELNSNKYDDFQILYKDIQVTIPSNFNQNSLAGLMKVLQEL